MNTEELKQQARRFLGGEALSFEAANALWKGLKKGDAISLARAVLERMRSGEEDVFSDGFTDEQEIREELCRQHALLTSKDPELNSAVRHDRALQVLETMFTLKSPALKDGETLGIAGGILKRRWGELGQLDDLKKSAALYERGAAGDLGGDAYPHINAAFVNDLLAATGDAAAERRKKADELRQRIVDELSPNGEWFNTASRVEALFGLRRYREATQELARNSATPEPWSLQTTAQQLATLAHLHERRPLEKPEIKAFFEALLPGAAEAVRSVFVGKVGLALSGGGFRASFYHLGVLARLADLDVLRHVEVLSCVSGGSIVGACYWLMLRRRLLNPKPMQASDYVQLVQDLIQHFEDGVRTDIRGSVQPSKLKAAWRLLRGEKGAMDPERTAEELEKRFYRPLVQGQGPLFMHDLEFTPADHGAKLTGSATFHPGSHNWLRAHKVPVLVLNATTVNTGHSWQFTPTWMGESPWAVYEAADSVPRLEWSWYQPEVDWQMRVGRAVAASACVPGVFAPVRVDGAYDDIQVQLVDGGVYDNQGTVALLALSCNVLLVSDAAGQLLREDRPEPGLMGLASYAMRSADTLMARVRLANYADLSSRRRSGLLRGLMFLHMKAGLDADTIRLRFSQETYRVKRSTLSPSGVRKDFQEALADLRTDLDEFSRDESGALMACGYKMAAKAFDRDLRDLTELATPAAATQWPFASYLHELESMAATTARRDELLRAFRDGKKLRVG